MDAAGGTPEPALTAALRASPERFGLVQAVRLLEREAARLAKDPRFRAAEPIGFDDLHAEVVRLRAALELRFPATEIESLDEDGTRPELSVTLMGLGGVSGVLPLHYSQYVLEALRQKSTALRDFLDVLNHRTLSFFVRASRKYRQPLSYEYAGRDAIDDFRDALLALVGMGEPSLQRRQPVLDETILYYAGHFAHQPRTASGLQEMLGEYLEQRVAVLQFQGRWLTLPEEERTRLTVGVESPRAYAVLGTSAFLGARSWDVNGTFRIRLGPLDYRDFVMFLPDGIRQGRVASLTRSYVGPALGFELQLVLKASEVPPLALSKAHGGPRLGWNTWLAADRRLADADDPVFELERD
jgi:type VI secretion system protein ImpH